MSFMFGRKPGAGKKTSGIQPKKGVIRIESIREPKKKEERPLPSALAERSRNTSSIKKGSHVSGVQGAGGNGRGEGNGGDMSSGRDTLSPTDIPGLDQNSYRGAGEGGGQKRKRLLKKKEREVQMRLESDSSSGEDDGYGVRTPDTREVTPAVKRVRVDGRTVDTTRKLRSREGKEGKGDGKERKLEMIHAEDLVGEGGKKRVIGVVGEGKGELVRVELKYPSVCQRERYLLIFGKDKIEPTQEIHDISKIVVDFYLTPTQAHPFTEPSTGILRQIEKAKNLLSRDVFNPSLLAGFKLAVDVYNTAIEKLVKEGALAENLDKTHQLPHSLIRIILRQVYDRAVSPKVDLLKQYENGTDNVYGELLPAFVSRVLAETGLKSTQTFVDLGSGVGNVILQAALEIGCESYGCEMMENACLLASAQQTEFTSRCRLWGLRPGSTHLLRGDFLENQTILAAMRKADVILVNNQAFTPKLNQNLIDLFLDLKNGCQIISLKSFVPHGHEISARNLSNPVNLLEVKRGEYWGGENVSWTDAGGEYFIARKDEGRLREFSERVARRTKSR